MIYFFNLKGEVPAKKNNRQTIKSGKTIPSKTYQKWHETAIFQLIFQRKTQKIEKPIDSEITVEINLTHGDYIRRDGDNGLSSILDTMKDARIIADDNWKICRRLYVENNYEKNNPFCEIVIKSYE